MLLYKWKVRALKIWRVNALWRRWQVWRGRALGSRAELGDLVCQYVAGHSFVDIGCMWGIHGELTFVAEAAGATRATGVDISEPTPEFLAKHAARSSSVKFIQGDISRPETIQRVGLHDVVLCAGVLYHHPSPWDVLIALRHICGQLLILRTQTIPEIDGLPNAAVYYPMLEEKDRRLWNLTPRGSNGVQLAITTPFAPEETYGNWFWGLTPSCVTALLASAGFRVLQRYTEAFSETFVCQPLGAPQQVERPDQG